VVKFNSHPPIVLETEVPRANRQTVQLPAFAAPARRLGHLDLTWLEVVTALQAKEGNTATYSEILEALGCRGDADRARRVRRALSNLITREIRTAPEIQRISKGLYRLIDEG